MQRFKRILMYTGTQQNEAAVSRAFELAIENEAKLTLMETIKPLPRTFGFMAGTTDPDEMERLIVKDHREKLLTRASEYLDTEVAVDVIVNVGDPAVEITRQVLRDEHDLVIKTANGRSESGPLFGGVARSLMRICPCPVWVLKPEVHGEFDRIVAAIDVEAADKTHKGLNRNILELAFSIAQRENAELHIVAAWELWMEKALRRRAGDAEVDAALAIHRNRVTRAVDDLLQAPGATAEDVEVHLIQGTPADVIRHVVQEVEADLLVMGTVCRTSVAGFLIGNTAETVVSDVDCSLLALKPDGFVSPVELDQDVSEEWSEGTASV
jgi:nucleotide-binding universal stress UspA family protein